MILKKNLLLKKSIKFRGVLFAKVFLFYILRIINKQLKLVEAWSIIHKEELEANWLLCKNYEELFNIQPLS